MAALAAVTRTEHAVVGEVYVAGDDGNCALGRITCIAHHWTVADGQASDLVWHLCHDDESMRTRAGWRIHGRALTINAIETRPVRRLRAPATDGPAAAADLQQLRLRLSHGKPTNTVDFGKSPDLPDPLCHSSSNVLLNVPSRFRSPLTAKAVNTFPLDCFSGAKWMHDPSGAGLPSST